MEQFKDRLKRAMEIRNISAAELSKRSGLSKAQISQYVNGIYQAKQVALYKLSTTLDVSEAWLMGHDVPMERNNSSNDNIQFAPNIRPITQKRFPMLGEIACGKPIFAAEDHESYIDASTEINADFCLTAKGDSMIGARINDGDVVFIKAMPIVNNGDIAAVVVGEEATLKRWYYYPDQQKLVLNAENSAYAPLVYVGEELNDIVCIGKAVCFMSNL